MTANKNHIIKFRCTAFERSLIKLKAYQVDVKISEYCRLQALKGKIVSRQKLTEEEKDFFRTLKEHNTNFVRISNLFKNKDPQLYLAIFEHLMKMKSLYSRFFPDDSER